MDTTNFPIMFKEINIFSLGLFISSLFSSIALILIHKVEFGVSLGYISIFALVSFVVSKRILKGDILNE
jgi:hypothetical protein